MLNGHMLSYEAKPGLSPDPHPKLLPQVEPLNPNRSSTPLVKDKTMNREPSSAGPIAEESSE